MQDDAFEWDDEKARTNLAKHRIDFRAARYVFEDAGALDEIDDRFDYGEERYRIVGMVNGRLMMVSYTLREQRIRIISASRLHANRKLIMQDKARQPEPRPRDYGDTDWAALDAMTDEEIEAAALSDPDNQPWPEGKPMRRGARVRYIRLKLGLTPTAFAERYAIPRDTIMAWERHKTDEDAVALAYLNAILADPEGVAAAVAKSRDAVAPKPKAAE